MKTTTLLMVLPALLMIWVASLQVNAAMTDCRLLSEANLGRKADVGAAADANKAAAEVTGSNDGVDDDTNPDHGNYNQGQDSSGSCTSSHHQYPNGTKPADANKAAAVVTSSNDGVDDDTKSNHANDNQGQDSSGSSTDSHHQYGDGQNPKKPKN